MSGHPTIALVGGFLGAGKTTLIATAAHLLQQRGMRPAVITNDQSAGLVDAGFLRGSGFDTREVTGGCFCCRFSDLMDSADQLRSYNPDIIFAEPVGSCIDLSSTTIQPLKAYHEGNFRIAPLTVLFDPGLAMQVFEGHADPDVEYLFRNQLEEADILCATKADLYPLPDLPFPVDFSLSAKTGAGVDHWLDQIINITRVPGSKLLTVDYERYAGAEAAMGWLNLHVHIDLNHPLSPALLAGPLVDHLEAKLTAAGIHICHLKIFDRAPSGFIKLSLCANLPEPQLDGDLLADPGLHHELALNLRAIAEPGELAEIVLDALAQIQGKIQILHHSAFKPAPPKPEYRFSGPT